MTSLRLQRANQLPLPPMLKRLGLAAMGVFGQQYSHRYEWLRRGFQGQPIFWGGAEAFTETHKKRLLSARLRAKFADLNSWEQIQPIYQRFEDAACEKSWLNWMTYLDLRMRLPELLLMRVDKMSMGVSLEGRVPFLDHKFVEFAMSIPESVKIKEGMLKYILKKSVQGVIPNELINRKKQGFGVPTHEWLFDRLGRQTRADLEAFCKRTDFLNVSEVRHLLDQRSPSTWYLLNFALWWNHFIA